MLDTDRARTDEFQGVHIDVLHIAWLRSGVDAAATVVAGEELGGDVLGMGFERWRALGGQLQLSGEGLVDASA